MIFLTEWKKQTQLIYMQLLMLLIRNILSIMDFEGKRYVFDKYFLAIFVIIQVGTIQVI